MPMRSFFRLVLITFLAGGTSYAATNTSSWVFPGTSGRLLYKADFQGNRVIDASGVGYHNGLVPLPSTNVVVVRTNISPVAGDNTANIQSAINYVQSLPLSKGFRGAVLLSAGTYPCASTIKITASGVVLRGVGALANGGTVLRATASNQYTLVQITGSGSASTTTSHPITNQYVPVGARSFNVDATSGFSVGDRVYVRRYTTTNWIHDIGMDLLTNPWTPSGYTINMDRQITRIEGNRIFIDAPVVCALDAAYTNGALVKYTWNTRITNSGIEHIYGISDYFGSTTNESHAWVFVQFNSTEHGWARDLTSQYFGYACVALYGGAKNITVADCSCLDPVSIITGGRRYAFVMDGAQMCVVKNCYTREDRHQYVTQSLTTGPNVFVDSLSDNAYSEAGPHHRWATGAIWDKITVNGSDLDAQNTCESGTGHGWEGANCVIWNSKANNLKVASPPTAYNWLIGSVGTVSRGGDCHGIISQPGVWESSGPGTAGGTNVYPDSLYFAELQDRLATPNLQTREYWLGIIDGFTNTIPSDKVSLDLNWSNAVWSAAAGQPLDAFNVTANNHWVPFTFNYSFGAEQIVGATLTLSLRATSSASGDVLYLGGTTNSYSFSSLGWLPVTASTTNSTVRVIDLANQLTLLTNGQFNAAVQGDIGIDWALLELQVAPRTNVNVTPLAPIADATVRGGTFAASNFGSDTNLTVKNDSSADNTRQAYLRWDLTGLTGTIYQARVRLTPLSVGTNGIEVGARVATSNAWLESAITYNNQPGAGERFATRLVGNGASMEFDVTPQVLDALQNDKQLSVQLYSVRNAGSLGNADFASRENANVSNRPQLLLTMAGAVPTISGLTNISLLPNGSSPPLAFTVGDTDSAADALAVTGSSSNPALIPDANIVFGGSGSNRTVTVTAVSNQTGVATITVSVADASGITASDTFTVTVSSHAAGVFIWNGTTANTNWSVAANWLLAGGGPTQGAPEFSDDVKFFDAGANGTVSNVNNFIDAAFSGIIGSLQYGNTNGFHTTLINAGNTLTLAGNQGLVVGTETDDGSSQIVSATITGLNGRLAMNNPSADLVVRQASTNNNIQRATLDMSGLGEFNADVDQILVGVSGGGAPRATGTLKLAKTNFVTATGSLGICIGDNSANGGGQNYLYLGQTNLIWADSITVGRQKANATLRFNPGLFSPGIVFRGSDGVSRVSNWNIADHSAQSSSSSSSVGVADFTGGTVDLFADVMAIAKSQKTTGANSSGSLTFTSGTIDVNTLQLGVQSQTDATSAGAGQINVNTPNALLNVNSLIELGHISGGNGTANSSGTLNINGGMVTANTISAGAPGSANLISMTGGTLIVSNTIGSQAVPISSFALSNASLGIFVMQGRTNAVVNSLTTGASSTNRIDVLALPDISTLPAQFPLIKYAGAIGGFGYNFSLGSFPSEAVATGFLSNNIANSSVDLVITSYAIPDAFLTWNGNVNADWDTETANWKNNIGPGLVYADGESVVFNDSAAANSAVSLTDTLTPGSMVVNNNSVPYLFFDTGNLSGPMSLTKQGSGNMTLANSGSNDFTGGVTISDGSLRVGLGGTEGNLPASGVIENDAALLFDHSDDIVIPNVISGLGTLWQIGSGVLTLEATNTFNGPVIVTNGTVRPGNALALGDGPLDLIIATNAGTLDINGQPLANAVVTVSGAGAGTDGAIVNAGPQQTSALRNVILAGDATFGGTGRWDIRNTAGAAMLTTSPANSAFNITKIGPNQVSLVGVSVIESMLGDIDVKGGTFALQTSTTQVGDPSKTITVFSNATLNVYRLTNTPLNKVLVFSNGATMYSENDSNILEGPVTIYGNVTNNVNNAGTRPSLTYANVIGGPGGIIKVGAAPVILTSNNVYFGDTVVSAGTLALRGAGSISNSATIRILPGATLDVNARIDTALNLTSGQTLSGNGSLNGNLVANVGSTVSPGAESIGTLVVSGAATLRGVTRMSLGHAPLTNDVLQVGGILSYGGTLMLTNLGGTFSNGDSFKLFSAGGYSGGFTNIVPSIPALNLAWSTNDLGSGILSVISATTLPPEFSSIEANGKKLVLRGSNGVPGWPYYLLGSSNVTAPMSNWTVIATNAFDAGGDFYLTNVLTPNEGQRFYRMRMD